MTNSKRRRGRTIVVFWSDVQTCMLVTYAFNCRTEHFEVVDVGCVRVKCPSQCLLLMTISLIGGVEDVVQIRDLAKLCLGSAHAKYRHVQGLLMCASFIGSYP